MGEIVVSLLSTFKSHYPRSYFWEDADGLLCFDPCKVSVFADDDNDLFSNAYARKLLIRDDPIELEEWEKRMTENPIVLLVTVARPIQLDNPRIYLEKYVVFVKSSHLLVRPPIIEAFNRCKKLQQKGKKFCIKISVSDILRNWHKTQVATQHAAYIFHGASFCLSTYKLQQLEDCLQDPLLLGCCSPCCLPLIAPYMLYRLVKFKKIKVKLDLIQVHDVSMILERSLAELEYTLFGPCRGRMRRASLTDLDILLSDQEQPPSYGDCNAIAPPSYDESSDIAPPSYDSLLIEFR